MKCQDKENKDNKDKENQNKNNSELFWNLALLMLIPMWIGIAPKWYERFCVNEHGLFLKNLYNVLDGRWLVNIPICLFLVFGIIIWCRKIWKDNNVRFHRFLLVVIAFVILLYPGGVLTYAKIVWIINYRILLLLLLAAVLVLMIVKGIKQYNKKPKEDKEEGIRKTKTIGFSDDNSKDKIPVTLQNYAKEIIERLLATDLSEQAYAVGITGEWGVGKTTFLNELKKTINSKAEVVEFNPWMCRTPEQVIYDFFASLRHQLSRKYSKLSRSIREYAKLVGSISVKPSSTIPFSFSIPIKQDSLYESKKALSEKFKKLPKPVVVIIDDIDRLASEEVFEVLRLIRNTADLSNIIYMVAYDKDYVTSVLKEEKNIKDSTAYLEKIFQIEVHLPKVEDYQIWETLYKDINKQSNNPFQVNFAHTLFNHFNQEEQELILRILDNYRRAKRFARLYMLNITHFTNQFGRELRFLDIFWLELLQIYDKKVYNILANETTLLLYYNNERFILRDGIADSASQDSQTKYKGDIIWKPDTPKILKLLFGKHRTTMPQSINYVENYNKYFTLSVSPFKLSISEMHQLFDKNADPEKIVKDWLNDQKYIGSILFQFKQVLQAKIEEGKLESFLYGILSLALQSPSAIVIGEIKKMLRKERYDSMMIQIANSKIVIWFLGKLSKDDNTIKTLSALLNGFYLTETYNENGDLETVQPLIISNNDIERLLIATMKTYLDKHPEITATDLLREEGTLPYIFKKCCVCVKEDWPNSFESSKYKQIAFDVVIEHFSKIEQKPIVQEYYTAMDELFKEKVVEKPRFDNPWDEDDYLGSIIEWYDYQMYTYFGEVYHNNKNSKLDEFKTKCFDMGKEKIIDS